MSVEPVPAGEVKQGDEVLVTGALGLARREVFSVVDGGEEGVLLNFTDADSLMIPSASYEVARVIAERCVECGMVRPAHAEECPAVVSLPEGLLTVRPCARCGGSGRIERERTCRDHHGDARTRVPHTHAMAVDCPECSVKSGEDPVDVERAFDRAKGKIVHEEINPLAVQPREWFELGYAARGSATPPASA